MPLTEGQLRSKRDEFWDTAPAFEGRKEIWDALRAAAVAAEAMDYELAQAILDGASVSVPNGYLTECYDELGARYQVPIYCLSYPINIVKEDNGRDSPAECSEPVDGGTETVLKLRLSHNCTDVKLAVYSTDTISMCKKKLQVEFFTKIYYQILKLNYFRAKKGLNHPDKGGFTGANYLVINFTSKKPKYLQAILFKLLSIWKPRLFLSKPYEMIK